MWQPRLGIAWNVGGKGTTVIRASGRLFDSRTPAYLMQKVFTDNGLNTLALDTKVDGEAVKAKPPVSSDDVLSQIEKDIVHILSEHGGTMATSEFKSVCVGMGVNRSSFYLNLLNSPIISRFAGGLYGLIGSRTVRKLEPARMQSTHGHRPLRQVTAVRLSRR